MAPRTLVVIGGTSGIGLELVRDAASRGERVVLTSRDQARADEAAASVDGDVRGLRLDLSEPGDIAGCLTDLDRVDGVVLSAIERDANTVREFDRDRALRLITLKLVGYTETVRALLDRMPADVATGVVLFGGRAKDAPYPGSTTVSTVNGGVEGLTATLALELAPIRVNALHPGIIGDSPFWSGKPEGVLQAYRDRTPGGELATMADIVGATRFLLTNHGVSGVNLYVDRGWRLT